MKKRILFILMACLICQSFIFGFNQQKYSDYNNSLPKAADDDYESNDSYDHATPLQNRYYYGMLILQDIDWFVLSLNASDNITIMIQTDSILADMEINFYKSDGVTPVAEAFTGGNGTMWIIAVPNLPETGNYYFSLLPLGDPFAYVFYDILDVYDDNYEENDVISESIDISESYEDDLLYCLDDDWFKIYLEEGSSIDIFSYYFKTSSFELNFIGTDGTTIIYGSEQYSEEFENNVYEMFSFDENMINTTGYYYIQVSSDSPTIYMFDFIIYRNILFEEMSISLDFYIYQEHEIRLHWGSLNYAEFYYIFRETSPITIVDGLTPYATTDDTEYWESIEENGTYYYVVMGNNGSHNSSISNCVNLTVRSFEEIPITLYLYQHGQYTDLDWHSIYSAEFYYIFRETLPITTVDGLTPYAIAEYSRYDDFMTDNGTFYYVIMANNGTHNSSISNCVNITIILYPFNEIITELNPIIPSNDEDGTIHLEWDSIYNASSYYIFREIFPITTIDGLTPIANSSYSYYFDQISENGTYYYVIVANNGTLNSSISNCESVTCSIMPFYEEEPYIMYIETDWEQTGDIWMYWTEINNAVEYYVYRDTNPISDIGGLEPMAAVDNGVFEDLVYENGTYYYVVVANNGSTDSAPSSCKSIEVSFPYIALFNESAPFLFEIDPNPSYNGKISLEWEKVEDSRNYYIYREISPITSIDGLTPIGSSYDSYNQTWHETQYYVDNITESGTYYYVVVAYNREIYSPISNCESVEVILERERIKISGFNILTFGLIISCMVSIIIVSIRKQRNFRNTSYLITS